MKAKLTTDWNVWKCSKHVDIAEGTEVDIVPHMEADAESALNRPEGMCYLCKLDDGTCTYIPAIYLEITDWSNIDWEQRRYEIAKDMLPTIQSINSQVGFHCGKLSSDKEVVETAIRFADELIKQLKKK